MKAQIPLAEKAGGAPDDAIRSMRMEHHQYPGGSLDAPRLLQLQRAAGNAAVEQLIAQRQQPPGTAAPGSGPPAAAQPLTFAQTGALFQQALPLLQSSDPNSHRFISRAQYGAASVVRSETFQAQRDDGSMVQASIEFQLVVAQAPLVAGVGALFNGDQNAISPQLSGPNPKVVVPMTIAISHLAHTSNELADKLFHEGMHMLLYMDRVLDGLGIQGWRSPYTASKSAYLGWFRTNASYTALRNLLIGLYVRPPRGATAQNRADALIDHLAEEKFIYDQMVTRLRKGTAMTPNGQVAREYLPLDLAADGITLPSSDPRFAQLMNLATTCLNGIDVQRQQAARPAGP